MSERIYLGSEAQAQERIPGDLTVSVVGCGYIGTCIGALLASRGVRVFGIDSNEGLVNELNRGTTSIEEPHLLRYVREGYESGKLTASTSFESVASSDIVIVTVGTPMDKNLRADLRALRSSCESIGEVLRAGSLVIIKSTVPPGTTEGFVREVLESKSGLKAGQDFGLAYSPERVSEGNAIQELQSVPIVVGGIDERSSRLAALFWTRCCGVEAVIVRSPTTAEMVKLADNQWIDLSIALANEVALVCDKLRVDAFEVIRAANTLVKGEHLVNILFPSVGVGGYCLSKDPWFFHALGGQLGIALRTPVCSRSVNEQMPHVSFERVRGCIAKLGLRFQDVTIAVLGVAYNNNTGDVRFTPAEPFLQQLEASGCRVKVFDPLAGRENIRKVTGADIGSDIFDTVSGAHLIACLAAHREFVETPLAALKARTQEVCWFFDGRRGFDPRKVREAGFLYTGIGGDCYSA